MGPKEDPNDAKERNRERRQALLERRQSAEETASGLTSDLSGVYGLRALSMFGMPGSAAKPKPKAKTNTDLGR